MSVVIRVSYDKDWELEKIKTLLGPMNLVCETAPQTGRFKRAYLKDHDIDRYRQRPDDRRNDKTPIR